MVWMDDSLSTEAGEFDLYYIHRVLLDVSSPSLHRGWQWLRAVMATIIACGSEEKLS